MASPDRDDADQEHSDRTTGATGSNGDPPRSRVRVKSPTPPPRYGAPRPREAAETVDVSDAVASAPPELNDPPGDPEGASSVFVEKGRAPRARVAGDDVPRHAPEIGLGWLGSPNGAAEASGAERSPRLVRAPKKTGTRVEPDLQGYQQVQGSHLGDRYVRVIRKHGDDFERAGPGHLVATEEALEARGDLGKVVGKIKRKVIGAPLTTAAAAHERLTKTKALAVLSSDALSSVAYATEEILAVLILAGVAALTWSLYIGAAIVVLLLFVGISYRQTIKAYPHGGGSYIVAKDNLGELPALTAAGALLFGYIVTVAVSIAAGVAALISAVPGLGGHRVLLGLGFILLVTLLNLRGIRESGSIFAVPTYLFLFGIMAMIAFGILRNATEGFEVHPARDLGHEATAGAASVGIFLILRAFSRGCAALTGVEAISDGVPAFQPPEWKNARATLTWMISILAVTFSGITFLAHQYGAIPMEANAPGYETVVSQIARSIFGSFTPAYYYIQFATLAILILAANTAFSDFPRLSFFLARDKYLPRQFTFRGDRLAYTTGIVTLGILSGVMLAGFGGETTRMIPLYAVGVFTAFTLSQSGMISRWVRLKERGWQRGLAINIAGGTATAIVTVVVGITNFVKGAWIVILLVPLLILMFKAINRHYTKAAGELAAQTPLDPEEIRHTVIVPIAAVNRIARQTLAYARSICDNVTAVHITDDEEAIARMKQEWAALGTDIPLVIIESPYRALVAPLLKYIDEVDKQRAGDTITVVLPEFIARHWWEHLLHNQSALRIKAALLFRPGTVVTSVPYHLERSEAAAGSR
jgi:amino acid transporter